MNHLQDRVPPAFTRTLAPLLCVLRGWLMAGHLGARGEGAQALGCTRAGLCPPPRSGKVTAQSSDSREPLGQGKCPAQPRRRSADGRGLHSQGGGRPGPRSGCLGWMWVCEERDLPVGDPLPGLPSRQHRRAGPAPLRVAREAPDLVSRNLNICKNVPLLHVLTETAESAGNQQVRRDDCPKGVPGRGQACGGLPTDGPNPTLVGLLMSRPGRPSYTSSSAGVGGPGAVALSSPRQPPTPAAPPDALRAAEQVGFRPPGRQQLEALNFSAFPPVNPVWSALGHGSQVPTNHPPRGIPGPRGDSNTHQRRVRTGNRRQPGFACARGSSV